MGISANQARFLSLTARQCDLEHRVQQICQRRLRLSSELERIATDYNNHIGNRKMFVSQPIGQDNLSFNSFAIAGYKVLDNRTGKIVGPNSGFTSAIKQLSPAAAVAAGYTVINNATDFQNSINANLGGKYMLTGDIDLSSLGTLSESVIQGMFYGTLDGNGYKIKNMNIITNSDTSGLFQTTSGANIKNIVLQDSNIDSTSDTVGALVGYAENTIINNCASVNGQINAQAYVGGLIGHSDANTTISSSYATGSVTGVASVGGLVGTNSAIIDYCYSSGSVHGGDAVGGLLGNNYSSLTNSFSTTNVIANSQAGGLVGYNYGIDANISTSYATGNISGTNYVGGLIGLGFQNCTISESYAMGTVNGDNNVGGFIGKMGWVIINNSYATGMVTGSGANVGGFVGENWASDSTVDNTSFWNVDTNPVGIGNNLGGIFNAQGLTTAQINNNAYTANGGWNPSAWDLSVNPPTLIGIDSIDKNVSLEEYLRNGLYSLIREADLQTQSPIEISGTDYEAVDWRTVPALNDELFRADDMDAENKYDRVVSQINSQDKKLQLEQSSVEVEYKAIVSEKEAVKKILDTNAGNSFKYFS